MQTNISRFFGAGAKAKAKTTPGTGSGTAGASGRKRADTAAGAAAGDPGMTKKVAEAASSSSSGVVLDLTDDGDGDGDGDDGSGSSSSSSSSSSSAALAAARLKSVRPDMVRAHKFGCALATMATLRASSSSTKQSGGMSEAGPFSTLNVPKGVKLTPLEQQVVECKGRYPDCLLMVQVGYKVQFFGDDAVAAAKHLGIYCHQNRAFMVAAVPTFRVLVHLRRLVKAGQKVALVRQTEIAAGRQGRAGPFAREVVGVFTPATVVDDADPAFADMLLPSTITTGGGGGDGEEGEGGAWGSDDADAQQHGGDDDGEEDGDSWLAAVVEQPLHDPPPSSSSSAAAVGAVATHMAVVAVDVRSHRVRVFSLQCDESSRQELRECLRLLRPLELVVSSDLGQTSWKALLSVAAPGSDGSEHAPHQAPAWRASLISRAPAAHFHLDTGGGGASACSSISISSKIGGQGLSWAASLPDICRRATRGLESYLQGFKLERCLLDPSVDMVEVAGADVVDATDIYASHTAHAADAADAADAAETAGTTDETSGQSGKRKRPSPAPGTGAGAGPNSSAAAKGTEASCATRDSFALDAVTCHDLELFTTSVAPRQAGMSALNAASIAAKKGADVSSSSGGSGTGRAYALSSSSSSSSSSGVGWGSLLWHLDRTHSAAGRRVLQRWIQQPLATVAGIRARQKSVQWLMRAQSGEAPQRGVWVSTALGVARLTSDIEKMLTALFHGRILPTRLRALLLAAGRLEPLRAELGGLRGDGDGDGDGDGEKCGGVESPDWLTEMDARLGAHILPRRAQRWLACLAEPVEGRSPDDLCFALTEDQEALLRATPATGTATAATAATAAAGTTTSVPAIRARLREAEAEVEAELAAVRIALGQPTLAWKSLKVGPTSTLHNLVEVPTVSKTNKSPRWHVPADWVLVNSTLLACRFHTPRTVTLQTRRELLQEELRRACSACWQALLAEVSADMHAPLRASVAALGEIDALASLAKVASLPGYVRPEVVDSLSDSVATLDVPPGILLKNVRHPVVERLLEDRGCTFVPNDVSLTNCGGARSAVVMTGPNMGGKSCYVRMVCLAVLLAQMGSHVPADYARVCVFDNICTRMGAGDDLAQGMSTFMAELHRTSRILARATPRSLVALDELGRGTSTFDGVAIARATLRYLVSKVGCTTLFVTHYPEVADGVAHDDGLLSARTVVAHMGYMVDSSRSSATGSGDGDGDGDGDGGGGSEERAKERVVFLYKAVEKASGGSYGLNAARLAGMDERLLTRAAEMAEMMAAGMVSSAPTEATSKRARAEE